MHLPPLLCPYADYCYQPTDDPHGNKYTFWLNNLSTACSDRNGDSILHLHLSDVGHILQSLEPEREKVPVAFALS